MCAWGALQSIVLAGRLTDPRARRPTPAVRSALTPLDSEVSKRRGKSEPRECTTGMLQAPKFCFCRPLPRPSKAKPRKHFEKPAEENPRAKEAPRREAAKLRAPRQSIER